MVITALLGIGWGLAIGLAWALVRANKDDSTWRR